jgi:glycosyltransferase involved in cell wall biosynthesis
MEQKDEGSPVIEAHNKKNTPLVSIVTPSYNQGEFIEDTLLSVKNQDYTNIEHIIVDGGSNDNTLEILKKYEGTYNMRWISEPDEGQSDAVNKGFKMSKGEILGWVNSDDAYFDISAISNIVKFFNKYSKADVIYGDAVSINENNLILYILKNRTFNYNYLKKACFITQPAAFFRKKIADEFQLSTNLNCAMDYDFWIRIGKKHKFQYVNRILAVDRTHKRRKMNAKIDEMIKESVSVSNEYGQHNYNWNYRIFSIVVYGLCSIYLMFELLILNYKYNFAFDLQLDNKLSIMFRQINPKKQFISAIVMIFILQYICIGTQ